MARDDLSDETKAEIQKYANAVDNQETLIKGTVKEQKYDQLDTMDQMTETGEFNGKPLTNVQKEQVGAFREEMANATTQEEIDDIEDRMMEYLYTGKIDGKVQSTTTEGLLDYSSAKVNEDGDTFANNAGDRKQGNNFSLSIDGTKYRVETGQAVLYGSELDKTLESYSQETGALAVVDGVLYARDTECWYVVEPRNNSFKEHWNTLKEKYGLKDYKDYDLGENGFDNSKARYNQGERNQKSEKDKINDLYKKAGANITIK